MKSLSKNIHLLTNTNEYFLMINCRRQLIKTKITHKCYLSIMAACSRKEAGEISSNFN